MKKLILSENKLNMMREHMNGVLSHKLPKYVYKSVKEHNTSLGESPSFPPSHDYNFDYKILKKRYSEIVDEMKSLGLPLDIVEAENLLSKLMRQVIEKETPIRPQLNKLAENVVIELFAVPSETVILSCELKDKIECGSPLRILPEEDANDSEQYTFSDVGEINHVDEIVKQRRFIDSLIQGYSLIASRYEDMYSDYFESHGLNELLDLYKRVNALNDYLVFVKKEEINKKNPSLVSYVGVHLGHGENKTSIKSQGLIFPYLLRETIRGFMELFSSHGLPKDNQKAQMIIRRADFTMAEPWDIRFGKTLWEIMFGADSIESNVIPYFFAQFCSLGTSDFFAMSQELLSKTKMGHKYVETSISKIKNDLDYQFFLKNIKQKNVDSSLINDGYLSSDELDDYTIEEDGNIEENQENEYLDTAHGMPLKRYMRRPKEAMDDDLVTRYPQAIPKFFKANKYALLALSDKELEILDGYDNGNYSQQDLLNILDNHPTLKKTFGKFCRRFAMYDNTGARYIYNYNQDVYSNNEWLIHFTPNVNAVAKYGFTKGTQDFGHLAVTHGENQDKEGYNFAFIADKATNEEAKYYLGDEDGGGAVMFKADGIEAYHEGDDQDQVIFWGPSARNFIPIYHGNIQELGYVNTEKANDFFNNRGHVNSWYVLGRNNKLLYSHSNIHRVVKWVEKNYFQYRNGLFQNAKTKNDYIK